jgi:very-short-patch-repair endonuclease
MFCVPKGSKNLHFRRQQVIAGFIVGFYCASARLVVEIDGAAHDETTDYDANRDGVLRQLGIRTLRISNESVNSDLHSVLRNDSQRSKTTNKELSSKQMHTTSPLQKGEGPGER